jgi:hypothetical protein
MELHKAHLHSIDPDTIRRMIEFYNRDNLGKEYDSYFRNNKTSSKSIIAQSSKKKAILVMIRWGYSAGLIATYLLKHDPGVRAIYIDYDKRKGFQALTRALNRLRKKLNDYIGYPSDRKFVPHCQL